MKAAAGITALAGVQQKGWLTDSGIDTVDVIVV